MAQFRGLDSFMRYLRITAHKSAGIEVQALDDFVQGLFLKLWTHVLRTHPANPESALLDLKPNYLVGCVFNYKKDLLRKQQRRVTEIPFSAIPNLKETPDV